MKPTANQVARAATLAAHVGYTYDELDCQAFVEHCVRQAGGRMDYLGTNDMARRAAWLGTLDEARAQGRLVPGAGLLIREATEANLPARYTGDGLGDFSHVGLYVGENALTDTDKNGRRRACDVVHSSATMGRVAGSTLQNGWTHALWFSEIDYAVTAGAGAGADGANADGTGGTAISDTSAGGTGARHEHRRGNERHKRRRHWHGHQRRGHRGGNERHKRRQHKHRRHRHRRHRHGHRRHGHRARTPAAPAPATPVRAPAARAQTPAALARTQRRGHRRHPRSRPDGGRRPRGLRHGHITRRRPGEAAQIGQPRGNPVLAGGRGRAGAGGADAGRLVAGHGPLHRRLHPPRLDDGRLSAEVRT